VKALIDAVKTAGRRRRFDIIELVNQAPNKFPIKLEDNLEIGSFKMALSKEIYQAFEAIVGPNNISDDPASWILCDPMCQSQHLWGQLCVATPRVWRLNACSTRKYKA